MVHPIPMRRIAQWSVLIFCAPMLAGCGGGNRGQAGSYSTENQNNPPVQTGQQRPGMTGKQKLALLAGAAALYYVYKTYKSQQQNAPANVRAAVPPGVQLYRSRSTGAIYYRDPNNPRNVHWLTIPNNRIEVPQDQYKQIMSEKSQWQNMPVHSSSSPPPGPDSY